MIFADEIEFHSRAAPTTWHMCWQAAVGREFLAQSLMHGRIRERLIDAHRKNGRVLVAYAVLPTEVHVLSEIGHGDTPSGIARAVGNVLARWVRAAQPVRSPVLAGRYRAFRIDSAADLRCDVKMLAWRPVFQGLCRTPSHCAFGSLRIALGLTPGHGFDARWILRLFGGSVPEARAALRTWISKRPSERELQYWELSRGLRLATRPPASGPTGPSEVRAAPAAMLVAAGGVKGIDGALQLLECWVAVKLDVRCPNVSRLTGAKGARGRALVACIAVAHRLCSAVAVARHFGRAKATLSEQMTACRARLADRQIIATPVQRIVEEALAISTKHVGKA